MNKILPQKRVFLSSLSASITLVVLVVDSSRRSSFPYSFHSLDGFQRRRRQEALKSAWLEKFPFGNKVSPLIHISKSIKSKCSYIIQVVSLYWNTFTAQIHIYVWLIRSNFHEKILCFEDWILYILYKTSCKIAVPFVKCNFLRNRKVSRKWG